MNIDSILKQTHSEWYWKTLEEIPEVFYKDVGGCNTQMRFRAILYSAESHLPCTLDLNFTCSLLYEDHTKVLHQEIMAIDVACLPLQLNGQGELLIDFRVNQVSRCHQNQRFRLSVMHNQENNPELTIDEHCSGPIRILSKHNKPRPKTMLRDLIAATPPPAASDEQKNWISHAILQLYQLQWRSVKKSNRWSCISCGISRAVRPAMLQNDCYKHHHDCFLQQHIRHLVAMQVATTLVNEAELNIDNDNTTTTTKTDESVSDQSISTAEVVKLEQFDDPDNNSFASMNSSSDTTNEFIDDIDITTTDDNDNKNWWKPLLEYE